MQLAILHHHLNRGGVSQVIVNHLRSLAALPAEQRPDRVVLVFDGQREGWPDNPLGGAEAFPIDLAVVPQVGYDASHDADDLADRVARVLGQHGLSPDNAILHAHNHSLGKNIALPPALGKLAEQRWRMLLQVHDFAEDNRPANYRGLSQAGVTGQSLYPQATQVHYASLTARDAAILRDSGLAPSRQHTLPNPVGEFDDFPQKPAARQRALPALGFPANTRLFLYPVRAIRRKNLGEMVLLSALAPEDTGFALTLAPMNPVELPSFDRWVTLAENLSLPCRFDTGGHYGLDFFDTLAASDAILTTSVAEGFGMVFLESWLVGRPLIGRDLPEVTSEFRENGLCLDTMYQQIAVPTSLLDLPKLHGLLVESYGWVTQEYGTQPIGVEAIDTQIKAADSSGGFDFGRLPPLIQADVIGEVAQSADARDAVLKANPQLAGVLSLESAADPEQVEANATAVRTAYSLGQLGARLRETYSAVLKSPVNGPLASRLDADSLLRHFVTPEMLFPVRTEP